MTDLKPDLSPVPVTDLPSPAPDNPLEALSWLGDTVEEVAEGLRARGIKGRRLKAFSCPLHNYLAVFGWDSGVSGFYISDNSGTRWSIDGSVLQQFVLFFDWGRFPDLIEP